MCVFLKFRFKVYNIGFSFLGGEWFMNERELAIWMGGFLWTNVLILLLCDAEVTKNYVGN